MIARAIQWVRDRIGLRDRIATPVAERDTGRWGEMVAEKHLLSMGGWRILGRRVRPGRRDEIDLVAREADVLVFVEVKTRRNEEFGRPIESVGRAKRHALSRAALRYLRQHRVRGMNIRFDVVEVVGWPGSGEDPVVRHIPNAFTLDTRYVFPFS